MDGGREVRLKDLLTVCFLFGITVVVIVTILATVVVVVIHATPQEGVLHD